MSAVDAMIETAPPPLDWAVVSEEVACPLCGYNLRGLTEPRCPECGYRFDWCDLLDPRRRRHPYLFEHHPDRNIRSFARTAIGGLQPRRFWKSLTPLQPSRPTRLLAYWGVGAVLYMLAVIAPVIGDAFVDAATMPGRIAASRNWSVATLNNPANANARRNVLAKFGSIQAYLDYNFPKRSQFGYALQSLFTSGELAGSFIAGLVPLVWPWLTMLALSLFYISMHRARIKNIHVRRCVLYSFDVTLWLGLICVSVGALRWIMPSLSAPAGGLRFGPLATGSWIPNQPVVIGLLTVLGIVVASYRLALAYRHYLRFNHPALTMLASQIVAILVFMNLLVIPALIR